MEGENVNALHPPACIDMSMNITENITLIDDGPRLCPLCNSIVKLFFINFNQKILMCENTHCEFPFGYEDLQFFKEDNEMETDVEISSSRTRITQASQFSGSIVSAAEWMDIERLNGICDSEDTQSTISMSYSKSRRKNLEQAMKAKEKEQVIKENLDKIKELNQKLYDEEHEQDNDIRNKEWIQNLYKIQEDSGVQLLNDNELMKVKKKEPKIGMGELKIDVTGTDSLSSIKIELINQSNTT